MKRAPIHQFIKELKARETTVIVVEAETPPLDLSKIPPDWTARVTEPDTGETIVGPVAEEIPSPSPAASTAIEVAHPNDWIKGQLLNVRNNGAEYIITILGEEFDPRSPQRALRFSNPVECQNFVSKWYARENHDPRAY